MMRRLSYRPYVLLLALLLCALSLPQDFTQRMRSAMVLVLSPSWRSVHFLKTAVIGIVPTTPSKADTARFLELEQENALLRRQIETVRAWLVAEEYVDQQLDKLKQLKESSGERDFYQRRSAHLSSLLQLYCSSLPATVIFREPASWSSSLWINVGEKDNRALGRTVVSKNSPVVVGGSLVGVVEHVGLRQSRVRLITDAHLVPAVRAVRSGEPPYYLAKGELYGNSHPLWRARGQLLEGKGFNYDFADEEGPARELRTGAAYEGSSQTTPAPLLKTDDVLVTSGLDGVFPPGLAVASVTWIQPLREGGCSYDLQALPMMRDLDTLQHVTVLPALKAGEL